MLSIQSILPVVASCFMLALSTNIIPLMGWGGSIVFLAASVEVPVRCLEVYFKTVRPYIFKKKIERLVSESRENSKSMLIVRTTDDWNRAFSVYHFLSYVEKIAENYSVVFLDGDSFKESNLADSILKNRTFDCISFHCHGAQHSILLAPDIQLTKTSTKIIDWIREHIKPGGSLFLYCCSTAKGEENIARQISLACKTISVYAPTSEASALSIPQFLDIRGKDVSCIYKEGIRENRDFF